VSDGQILITGANLVLPDTMLRGDLLIKDHQIEQIISERQGYIETGNDLQVIKAEGMYLLPGMIDLHSDAIEKEIAPRSQAYFPINSSFYELEKKVVASGITTIYHSLSLGGETNIGVRNDATVVEIIENINRNSSFRSMINNLVHLRYEVSHLTGLEIVRKMLKQRKMQLLSFMDHTPGQGQFAVLGSYEEYMMRNYGLTEEEVLSIVKKVKSRQKQVDVVALKKIADLAKQQGITLASHDDDTEDKINVMRNLGVTVSEFPINLETAQYAKSRGFHVVVGAPNVVRGGSHSNNLKALDAIKAGVADILCSDYYPPAMSAAVFRLAEEGMDLPSAVRMVSLNPAKALGLDQQYGSIEVGKQADLVLVELYQGHPFIRKTLVGGKVVYQTEYQQKNVEVSRLISS